MTQRTPTRRVLQGLLAAGMVGWISVALGSVAPPVLVGLVKGQPLPSDQWTQFGGLMALLAIFGIPTASFVAILFGWPIWRLAEKAGLDKLSHGLIWGALCGAVIAITMTCITLVTATEGMSYSSGGGMQMVDGKLTSIGWLQQAHIGMWLTATGAVAGFVALQVAWRGQGSFRGKSGRSADLP